MAASPLPELSHHPYDAYIAELREFFTTSRVPFGSPEDLHPIVARLSQPGPFADDLGSLVRSFILRQGGAMPHAQLLEILTEAIAGPAMKDSPQQHQDSLRQLLAFISGIMRRPWNVPPNQPGQLVPFPSEATPEPNADQSAAQNEALTDTEHTAEASLPVEPIANPIPTQLADITIAHHPEPAASIETFHPNPQPSTSRSIAPTELLANSSSQLKATQLTARDSSAIGAALAEQRRESVAPSTYAFPHNPPHATTEPSHPVPPAQAPDQTPPTHSANRRPLWLALAATAAAALAAIAVQIHRTPETYRIQPAPALTTPASTSMVQQPSAQATQPVNPYQPGKPLAGRTAQQVAAGTIPTQPTAPPTQTLTPQPTSSAEQTSSGTLAQYPQNLQDENATAPEPASAPHPTYRPNPDAHIVGDLAPRYSPSASSPALPRSRFNVSSGVMAANLISSPLPAYPILARLAHIQGQVILQAVVAKDGSVSSTHVLRGHHLLRGAAQDAVRRWRFRPFRVDGRPVDAATIVTVDFRNPT